MGKRRRLESQERYELFRSVPYGPFGHVRCPPRSAVTERGVRPAVTPSEQNCVGRVVHQFLVHGQPLANPSRHINGHRIADQSPPMAWEYALYVEGRKSPI